MKTVASTSYTVAWFKIADIIARGEKERALHMYPLLMHSVSDPAISFQLEGDILMAFDDIMAIDRYHQAAELYKKSGKIKQAISIYEHVLVRVEDEKILKELLDLYVLCHDLAGFVRIFIKLSKFYVSHDYPNVLDEFVESYQHKIPANFFVAMYAQYIRILLMDRIDLNDLNKKVEFCLQLFLNLLEDNYAIEKEFQQFLSELNVLDPQVFQQAQNYLCQK